MTVLRVYPVLALLALCVALPPAAFAQCDAEPPVSAITGPGQTACPCFVEGEEAGAVFDVPAEHYPIELLTVIIGWGSQFGGAPTSLEQAIHIYPAGLPDPGTPQESLLGPQLNDGFLNQFDLEAQLGAPEIASGPFSVTLEFLNENAGSFFAPSVVHDGNGCIPGKNLVKAIPGGWADACSLGVTGDWVFIITYRRTDCEATGVEELYTTLPQPAAMLAPTPNPTASRTAIDFALREPGAFTLSVFDVAGRPVRTLLEESRQGGVYRTEWDVRDDAGRRVPGGIYFVALETAGYRTTQKVLVRD